MTSKSPSIATTGLPLLQNRRMMPVSPSNPPVVMRTLSPILKSLEKRIIPVAPDEESGATAEMDEAENTE